MKNRKIDYITWSEIDLSIIILSNKIKSEMPNIKSIYGICRGGLIPAVMLSHKLDLPLSNSIDDTTLVIDDICDSGKTLKNSGSNNTAVIFYKPHISTFTPSVYAIEYNDDDWIMFPWENKDNEKIQDYLKK